MLFRREDNDEVFEATFEQAVGQDCVGFITLEDGVKARRVATGSGRISQAVYIQPEERAGREVLDTMGLGFGQHQFEDFEKDRLVNGFKDVEFVRDKDVPQFFNVKCDSRGTWERYAKHRGFVDNNKSHGQMLSAEELRLAKEAAARSIQVRQDRLVSAGLA